MNAEIFEEWVKDLCSALEEPSLILLDNASYHSRKGKTANNCMEEV
jgi:hypothetical protein